MQTGKEMFGKERYKLMETCHKMLGYIDFYIYLLDNIEENYAQYIQTKQKKYLNQTEELETMLKDAARKALKDVWIW